MHRQCAGKDALVALWAGDAPSWGLEGQRNEGERIMERAWDSMRAVCRASGGILGGCGPTATSEGGRVVTGKSCSEFVSSHLITLSRRVR